MDGGRILDSLDLLDLLVFVGVLVFAGTVAVAATKAEANKAPLILLRKKYPAHVKAKEIRNEIAHKWRDAEMRARIAARLPDYLGNDVPDEYVKAAGTSESDDDPVRIWLPAGEYEKLTEAERNQLALDRWKAQTRHSAWEIDRDYERFVAFLFESKLGYDVAYDGAIATYGDMQRVLICKRDNQTLLVQCKRWRPERIVREKHVFALFGCALEYCFSNGLPFGAVRPVLLITKTLTPEAKNAAEFLKVAVCENAPMDPGYPRIKCNIASDGEKIFHLPFDQMYDHAKIKNPGECYVATVAEAMELGFRRAWKWRGARQQTAA